MKIEICFANTKLLLENQDTTQLKCLQECIRNGTIFRISINEKIYYINGANVSYITTGE